MDVVGERFFTSIFRRTLKLFCDLHFYDDETIPFFHPLRRGQRGTFANDGPEKRREIACRRHLLILEAKKSLGYILVRKLDRVDRENNNNCVLDVVFLGENWSRIWNYMERKRTLAYIPLCFSFLLLSTHHRIYIVRWHTHNKLDASSFFFFYLVFFFCSVRR